MSKTENGIRYYTCKHCGAETKEPLRSWKKKSQKDKNICPWCIDRRRVAAQARKEMNESRGFGFFGGSLWP